MALNWSAWLVGSGRCCSNRRGRRRERLPAIRGPVPFIRGLPKAPSWTWAGSYNHDAPHEQGPNRLVVRVQLRSGPTPAQHCHLRVTARHARSSPGMAGDRGCASWHWRTGSPAGTGGTVILSLPIIARLDPATLKGLSESDFHNAVAAYAK